MRTYRTTIGLLCGMAMGVVSNAHADHGADLLRNARVEHVLLISVDGLHALDVERYIEHHPNSALAELAKHGVTYSNASTPANSDSFPGLLALAAAAACSTGPCGFVMDDDVALIWLQDQTKTQAVADYLNTNAKALFIENVMAGDSLKLKFNDPLSDSRTPDLLVQPEYGTIYTKSTKKNAEHGGFGFSDTNAGLIVSHPYLRAHTIKTPVATSQVAPTILEALGLEAEALQAVRIEHTPALPGLGRSEE